MSTLTIAARAAALALALAVTLGGCGDDPADTPAAERTAANGDVFNQADVDFATQMIPHHAQAIQMVVLAQDRPLDPAVRELADGIREAQVGEVQTMVGWLTAWGEEIPETSLDHVNGGHGDEMHDVGGEMQELADASDEEFQELWLQLMVEHHEGAVEMARDEEETGAFQPATRLAGKVVTAQEREIAEMEALLE